MAVAPAAPQRPEHEQYNHRITIGIGSTGREQELPLAVKNALLDIMDDVREQFGDQLVPANAKFSSFVKPAEAALIIRPLVETANAAGRNVTSQEVADALKSSLYHGAVRTMLQKYADEVATANGLPKPGAQFAQILDTREPAIFNALMQADGPEAADAALKGFEATVKDGLQREARLAECRGKAGDLVKEAIGNAMGVGVFGANAFDISDFEQKATRLSNAIANGEHPGCREPGFSEEAAFRELARSYAARVADSFAAINAQNGVPEAAKDHWKNLYAGKCASRDVPPARVAAIARKLSADTLLAAVSQDLRAPIAKQRLVSFALSLDNACRESFGAAQWAAMGPDGQGFAKAMIAAALIKSNAALDQALGRCKDLYLSYQAELAQGGEPERLAAKLVTAVFQDVKTTAATMAPIEDACSAGNGRIPPSHAKAIMEVAADLSARLGVPLPAKGDIRSILFLKCDDAGQTCFHMELLQLVRQAKAEGRQVTAADFKALAEQRLMAGIVRNAVRESVNKVDQALGLSARDVTKNAVTEALARRFGPRLAAAQTPEAATAILEEMRLDAPVALSLVSSCDEIARNTKDTAAAAISRATGLDSATIIAHLDISAVDEAQGTLKTQRDQLLASLADPGVKLSGLDVNAVTTAATAAINDFAASKAACLNAARNAGLSDSDAYRWQTRILGDAGLSNPTAVTTAIAVAKDPKVAREARSLARFVEPSLAGNRSPEALRDFLFGLSRAIDEAAGPNPGDAAQMRRMVVAELLAANPAFTSGLAHLAAAGKLATALNDPRTTALAADCAAAVPKDEALEKFDAQVAHAPALLDKYGANLDDTGRKLLEQFIARLDLRDGMRANSEAYIRETAATLAQIKSFAPGDPRLAQVEKALCDHTNDRMQLYRQLAAQQGKKSPFKGDIHEKLIHDANRSIYIFGGKRFDMAKTDDVLNAFKDQVKNPKARRFLSGIIQQELFSCFHSLTMHVPLEEFAPGRGHVEAHKLPGAELLIQRPLTSPYAGGRAILNPGNKTYSLDLTPDGKSATVKFTTDAQLLSSKYETDVFGHAIFTFELQIDLANEDDIKVTSFKVGQNILP